VALAIQQHDLKAVGLAVLTMLLVILVYDILLFRPLVAWAEKFRLDASEDDATPTSWVLEVLRKANGMQRVWRWLGEVLASLTSIRLGRPIALPTRLVAAGNSRWAEGVWYACLAVLAITAGVRATNFIGEAVGMKEAWWTVALGFFTLARVAILIVIASLVWVPIGVWIGLRPRWAERLQPVTQFLAAFPSNLLFPVAVVLIVRFRLIPDIWLSPLMILGAQWYILFNVIAGVRAFPADLLEAAASMRLKGWSWWRRVMIPGILPAYFTGAITASGGAWNAAIVAEVANWGSTKLEAHGLGAYIADATVQGDLHRVMLGVGVMAVYVVLVNRLFWEPLFEKAAKRQRAD